jgi:hypothetical protein
MGSKKDLLTDDINGPSTARVSRETTYTSIPHSRAGLQYFGTHFWLISVRNYWNTWIYFSCQSHILHNILLNNLLSHLPTIYTVWTYYAYNQFKCTICDSFLNSDWHKKIKKSDAYTIRPGTPHCKLTTWPHLIPSVTMPHKKTRQLILCIHQRKNF